jgi:16S rRNA (cytosine967-C5)-methyltransferase
LINAVLRRIGREGSGIVASLDAVRMSVPDWLWDSWVATYGEAKARAIIAAQGEEPPLDLTVKADPALWAERLGGRLLPTGSIRLGLLADIPNLPGFAEGAWWVQDAAAALPARLLGDVAGQTVADLCAAPGGKTAQLAAAGAIVTAVDRAGRRLGRLRENLERLSLSAEIVEADTATWAPGRTFDRVLLDAPCSATGTIRRHPDIAWSKTPADVAALAAAQDRLLAAAVRLTRPGGVLVYSVCSLEADEAEHRLARVLADGAVERLPIRENEVGGLAELVTTSGDLRATPADLLGLGGLDGFFAARLRRTR